MIARARHCKYCQGIFLPASAQASSAVQCPHCSRQMMVGECATAGTELNIAGRQFHSVTEEEEQAERLAAVHNRWTRRLVLSACGGLAAAAGVFGWQRWRRDEHLERKERQKAALVESEKAAQRERQEIDGVVRRILGAKTWEDMMPDVVDANRVREMMAWFYSGSNRRHEPEEVLETGDAERLKVEGRVIVRIRASTPTRAAVWLILAQQDGKWKLDWEVYANAHTVRWHAFVHEAAGATVELRLLAARKPAADAFIVRAGGSPESDDAVVVWTYDREASACAVLRKTSPLWRDLDGIGFNEALKIIAQVTMLVPDTDPPLVRIDRIVQKGWLRAAPMAVPDEAPPQ